MTELGQYAISGCGTCLHVDVLWELIAINGTEKQKPPFWFGKKDCQCKQCYAKEGNVLKVVAKKNEIWCKKLQNWENSVKVGWVSVF